MKIKMEDEGWRNDGGMRNTQHMVLRMNGKRCELHADDSTLCLNQNVHRTGL